MRHEPTGKTSGHNAVISALGRKGHCWTEVLPRVVRFLGIHADVQELHALPVLRGHELPHKHKKRPSSFDFVWLEIVQGGYDDTMIDEEISKIGGCLIIDAKGVFDAIHRNGSAALSMQDQRSTGERLALREASGRTRTSVALVSQRGKRC